MSTRYSPFIVAEMGASHNGSLRNAIALVEAAAAAGADAIKLQTYTPDCMVADKNYVIESGPWAGKKLYELYAEAMTPWEWTPTLFQVAKDKGIECFSTPCSVEAVNFLEHLDCPRYKIASFELVDLPLIEHAAKTGKPLILSTGMASIAEIHDAITTARRAGAKDITLLKCTSNYPADPKDANLLTMHDMGKRFDCKIGISDHTFGSATAITSACLRADMIEKHIRLDNQGGHDSGFAITPLQFAEFVGDICDAVASIGDVVYGPREAEADSAKLRRSIYVVKPIRAGDKLTADNVGLRRPAAGMKPFLIRQVIAKGFATQDLAAGTPLRDDVIRYLDS